MLNPMIKKNKKANYKLKSDQYKSNLFEYDLSSQTLKLNPKKQNQME